MSNEPVFLEPSPILAALGALDVLPDTRCKTGRWLDTLADDDMDGIVAAVRRSNPTTVRHALARHNLDGLPSETVWRRHWNGHCGCGKDAA